MEVSGGTDPERARGRISDVDRVRCSFHQVTNCLTGDLQLTRPSLFCLNSFLGGNLVPDYELVCFIKQ